MRKAIESLKIYQQADKAMGKLVEKLDLVKKAGKIEMRGDRKFSNGNFAKLPILFTPI
jgi:hypothetical protein